MNLIERLDGYEKAKQKYSERPFDLAWSDIGKALLKHRRAKNISEVGDKAVYKGKAGLSGLFEIETLTKTGKPKTVKTKRFGNFPCRYCEVQHATDKEIAQGYRDA